MLKPETKPHLCSMGGRLQPGYLRACSAALAEAVLRGYHVLGKRGEQVPGGWGQKPLWAVCCWLPSLFLILSTSLPVPGMKARDVSREQKQKKYPAAMVQCTVQHCACCLGELSSLQMSFWFLVPAAPGSGTSFVCIKLIWSAGWYSVHLERGELVSKLWYVSLRSS